MEHSTVSCQILQFFKYFKSHLYKLYSTKLSHYVPPSSAWSASTHCDLLNHHPAIFIISFFLKLTRNTCMQQQPSPIFLIIDLTWSISNWSTLNVACEQTLLSTKRARERLWVGWSLKCTFWMTSCVYICVYICLCKQLYAICTPRTELVHRTCRLWLSFSIVGIQNKSLHREIYAIYLYIYIYMQYISGVSFFRSYFKSFN
jgi:hypothetical protein